MHVKISTGTTIAAMSALPERVFPLPEPSCCVSCLAGTGLHRIWISPVLLEPAPLSAAARLLAASVAFAGFPAGAAAPAADALPGAACRETAGLPAPVLVAFCPCAGAAAAVPFVTLSTPVELAVCLSACSQPSGRSSPTS